nr:cytochrome p450 monooxygenase yanh [Quercus suber]
MPCRFSGRHKMLVSLSHEDQNIFTTSARHLNATMMRNRQRGHRLQFAVAKTEALRAALSPAVVLLLLLGLALLVYALCKFVQAWYDAYSSPLAMLPNAGILAPISKLFWIFPHEYRGISTLVLPRLHDKLGQAPCRFSFQLTISTNDDFTGPLVRIGPKTVSFYSMDIYDVVYAAGSGYRRDPRIDKEEHARRRRMMGQLFNRNKMVGLRDIMLDEINHFITVMRQRNDWVINASAACRSFEADIISRFSFGIAIGAVSSWSEGDMLGLIKVWESFESVMFRLSGWRTHYTSYAYSKTVHSASVPPEAPNFMLTLIDAGLAPKTALSEARENLGPGTDTTSSTLAHILFALSHCPCFQQKLREELVNLEFPTDFTNLESCPKLTACIKEGIRWAGAASAMLPRVVPPEGAVLAGHFLPGGVRFGRANLVSAILTLSYSRPSSRLRQHGIFETTGRTRVLFASIHIGG